MPVTITANHLAVAVRVIADANTVLMEPWATTLAQDLASAKAIVELYAPDAPDDVLNEAVTLIVGYKIEAPHYTRMPQNAFINSGAKAELSPWHVVSAATVGES